MIHLTHASDISKSPSADVLVIPFWQHKTKVEPACIIKSFHQQLKPLLQTQDFVGKEGETLFFYFGKGKRLLLLGLGEEKKCTAETMRRSFALMVKAALKKKLSHLNILVPQTKKSFLKAVCEGMLLANYRFDRLKEETLKEEKSLLLSKICLIGTSKEEFKECEQLIPLISSVHFTRDLVNDNADKINAQFFSALAKEMAKEFGLKATILDKKYLEKEKMGLILAVNRGAAQDPAVILLEHRGNPHSKECTVIIGKGISFDTGGLNLKPTGGIETMKADMAGAACVFGTLRAAAELGLKQNVIGIIASAENAIGPNSYKPGDVYRSMSGKTVEISNTDAEGRLILADALSYAVQKLSPTRIIDLATLTGGILVALGEETTGLFSNHDKLAEALYQAGEETFERVWRLPIYPEYKDALKSTIADLKNAGGRKASSITGAIFLQQFVKEVPWAHLDIAGTAYLSEIKMPYHSTPATGVGVRLLIEFLQKLPK